MPAAIRLTKPLALGEPLGEHELIEELKNLAADNQVLRSFIGQGYYDTITPPVILRNVLENPGWYTQYTPYQAEISQGRLEALVNFQTMIEDLTGLPMANASLLDEATAAAEAMKMCFEHGRRASAPAFWVDAATHPQTIAVMRTRAEPLGIELRGRHARARFARARRRRRGRAAVVPDHRRPGRSIYRALDREGPRGRRARS